MFPLKISTWRNSNVPPLALTTRSRAAKKSFFSAAQIHLRCPCPKHGRSSNTAVVEVCKNLRHSAILVWGKSTGILFLEFQNLIQKNRHFSFLQRSYRVRDISRGVKCRDSMLSNNMRSSLWKNFGVIQVFKQTHESEMKRISMRKTVPLDPSLRKHERHMSCYCTFQIAPNMNDFFFF